MEGCAKGWPGANKGGSRPGCDLRCPLSSLIATATELRMRWSRERSEGVGGFAASASGEMALG